MSIHELSATLKNQARMKLNGKYGNSALLTFLHEIIILTADIVLTTPIMFISSFSSMLTGTPEDGIGSSIALLIASLLISVFIGVLNTGVSLYYLNITCGRIASVANLFYGYQYMFKKSLSLSAVVVAANSLPLLPYNVLYLIYNQEQSQQWLYYTLIAYVIGISIYIPLSLCLSQSYYLLLDFPKQSVKEILSTSIRLMRGRKRQFFYIQLSFFPLMLLSVFTLGIGNLWLTPYMQQTTALYFLHIMNPDKKQTSEA